MIIWALGYFPRNQQIIQQYDKKIEEANLLMNNSSVENNLKVIPTADYKGNFSEVKQNLESEKMRMLQENSFIGRIGKFIQPVMRPLGFDWKMSVSLLAGVAAKEVVVSTMGVLFQTQETKDNNSKKLQEKLKDAKYSDGQHTGAPLFTPVTAFAYLMFVLLYFPCVAVVAAVKKESGKWKWALFMITYTTTTAWLVAFLVNQVGSFFI